MFVKRKKKKKKLEQPKQEPNILEEKWTNFKEKLTQAEKYLPPTNPTRLGLVLNYSIFLYEELSLPGKAIETAKKGFEEALGELEEVEEEGEFREVCVVMGLLRDNLERWMEGVVEGESE